MNFIIRHIFEIDSTNSELMRNFDEYENYTIITADHQTGGKGRLNRRWVDNGIGNLLFSILLKNIVDISDINKLNFTVCAAIISTLEKFNIIGEYKWPNDILVNNRKISGVLIENKLSEIEVVTVIGVGLNVNRFDNSESEYIFMSDLLDTEIDKLEVLKVFTSYLRKLFLKNDAFDICRSKHCYYGKRVTIKEICYEVGDIHSDGCIVLKDNSANESRFFGSELSISGSEIIRNE